MTLTSAPVLETPRLILRGPEARDLEPQIKFLTDPVRSEGFGGYDNPHEAWRWCMLSVGHWHLHGYGYFTIEDRATGQAAGICGIWNPSGWPEPEIGWVVFEGYEGKGIAYEAAVCVRDWAYSALGMTTLTSAIVPSNTRSIALAERMGAWFECEFDNVQMGREFLYRHPGPEALSGPGMEAYA
jgi:RimJ/RimL family protein N-acetyltransferase